MKPKVLYVTLNVILGSLLLYLLWWRWQISRDRFFDVDEFTHLHWAANMVRGERPYVDFFTFFTPGYYWFLNPLFVWFGDHMVFVAARTVAYGVFIGILGLTAWLFASTRSLRWAMLPVILLAFLPVPYDKFLEVRPDNLATLLALGGLVLEILALGQVVPRLAVANENLDAGSSFSHGKNSYSTMKSSPLAKWIRTKFYSRPGEVSRNPRIRIYWFISGILYAMSLIVLAKMIPFVLVGIVVAILAWWWTKDTNAPWFLAGLLAPSMLFVLWLLSLGDFGLVWYSLTKMPLEANMIGKFAIMEPHLFFFPNVAFYGAYGVTLGLILNHAIWIVGIIVGVGRFFTPFITGDGEKRTVLVELLIAGTFLLSVVGYVQFFPLKHSQYLIPIAVFIAYYCADFFLTVGRRMVRWTSGEYMIVACVVIACLVLVKGVRQINQVKLGWGNAMQMAQINALKSTIDSSAEVLDLEGRMLFWKDGYTICCLPFGSFTQFLSRPPRKLSVVLEEKKVPYIYQGDTGRFKTLSAEDQAYIRLAYAPVSGWGESLWQRKK